MPTAVNQRQTAETLKDSNKVHTTYAVKERQYKNTPERLCQAQVSSCTQRIEETKQVLKINTVQETKASDGTDECKYQQRTTSHYSNHTTEGSTRKRSPKPIRTRK